MSSTESTQFNTENQFNTESTNSTATLDSTAIVTDQPPSVSVIVNLEVHDAEFEIDSTRTTDGVISGTINESGMDNQTNWLTVSIIGNVIQFIFGIGVVLWCLRYRKKNISEKHENRIMNLIQSEIEGDVNGVIVNDQSDDDEFIMKEVERERIVHIKVHSFDDGQRTITGNDPGDV